MKRSPINTYSKKKGARSGQMKECAAEGCANTFYRTPANWAQKFCSRPCAYANKPKHTEERKEAIREQMKKRIGEANPNYRHGKKLGKRREFERAFNLGKKGESHCRVCGSTQHLQLHHAIPRSIGTKESRLDIRNGITLCASCHARWHKRSLVIPRTVFTVEEWDYLESVQLTGRVTSAWLDDNYPSMEVLG